MEAIATGEARLANGAELEERDRLPLRRFEMPSIERIWVAIRNNRLLIAGLLLASLAIGLFATLLMTPQYQAAARVEISRIDGNVAAVQGAEAQDQIFDEQYYRTQYELLKSRSLARQIVRHGKLINDTAFLEAFDIDVGDDEYARDPERYLVKVLLDNVTIAPIRASNLVDIKFTSPSPVVSARIANLWANEFISNNLNQRFGATSEARKFLEERLDQLRRKLEDAERELIAYAAQRNLFPVGGRDKGNEETASQTLVASDLQALNDALAEAAKERIAAQSALDASKTALSAEQEAALVPLRQKRAELAAEAAQLRATAGEEYPTVRAITNQISELDREIARIESGSRKSVYARYKQAVETERRLQAKVNELQQKFVQQRRDSVQYNILQREVDTTRSLYNAVLQRYGEIGVAGVGKSNITLVDEAEVPTKPSQPNLLLNLVLSLLLGGAVAGGVIILRETLDQSIRDPSQVSDELGIPLLGVIPSVSQQSLTEAIQNKYSELYEAYFSLFTSLGFLTSQGVPRRLMLTSTRAAEGKSLSSVALAKILAERGKRVLLVDADMRHSSLSKYIDVSNEKGLSHFLRGEDDWQSLIKKAEPFDFDILPAGRQPPNAAELLDGERFKSLLSQLEKSYDHIIVDSPPILGLADVPLIARIVDGVVVVVEANRGKLRMVAQALERLERGGAKIFGAVVTKLDDRNLSYGYGYGYGYGYSYGEKGDLTEPS